MTEIGLVLGGIAGLGLMVSTAAAFAWYRVVPPSEAHLVVTPNKRMVCSSDPKISKLGGATYFELPSSLPFVGRATRVMDVTIKELVVEQETYEQNQARYMVRSSTKYRIVDVEAAAETFISDDDLQEQLQEVVRASVRAVTVKYDVVAVRAMKQKMAEEVEVEIKDDLSRWGLELVSFQLVDFQDTKDSSIISDISLRREVEIEATTREQNAEKKKQARVKEAEAEEVAKSREIKRDEAIDKRAQAKLMVVAEQEKLAKEKEYAVVRVQTIKQAEIDKEKALVEANQNKEVEAVNKEQKLLDGEGEKLLLEQVAIGNAAEIRERGRAEAEAKELLQAALNKFGDAAIKALVAEKIVSMQETVGVETAKALAKADLRVFSGGSEGQKSFDLGQMVSSLNVSNKGLANSVLNNIARPNDLGLKGLDVDALLNAGTNVDTKEKEKVKRKVSK